MENNTLYKNQQNEKKNINVLVLTSRPYIIKETENEYGFYLKIWQKIKNILSKKYTFNETFSVGYFPSQNELVNYQFEKYDMVIGLFNLKHDEIMNGWSITNPIFLHTSSVVIKNKFSFLKLFLNLFIKKYIPLFIIFVIISVILGLFLFKFTHRKSKKNAIWQTLTATMGQTGYLTEKLSDNYKKTTLLGYIVTSLILVICLYCFMYMQATISTTMLFSNTNLNEESKQKIYKYKHFKNKRFLSNLKRSTSSVDSDLINMDFFNEGSDTKDFDIYKNTEKLLEHYKDDKKNKHDGIVLDTLVYNDINYNTKESMYKIIGQIDQIGISMLVRDEFLNDVNKVIYKLHQTNEISFICDKYIKTIESDNFNTQCKL